MTTTFHPTDFIGDIHGYADELLALLEKMGYSNKYGYYQHQHRKAFFCGDFIDRGPQIKEVLEIVKPMIDEGAANTVIGNHEYNAICYHTLHNGMPLRKHSAENNQQHRATLDALSEKEMQMYIEWFKTLPIYFENDAYRIVHAQWEPEYIKQLKAAGRCNFSDENWFLKTTVKGSEEFKMVECLLKGREMPVEGFAFFEGNKKRTAFRMKWWKRGWLSCNEALFNFDDKDKMMAKELQGISGDKPVFFGHYWMKDEHPVIQNATACCLDYSVARDGKLVAYQWDGETNLDSGKLVSVPARKKTKDVKMTG